MLDSILAGEGSSVISLTVKGMLICSIASIILGLIIAITYMICSEKYSKNFVVTLVILPILVQAVIMMVNGNLGTGVAIVGAFSLVRFRSIPGTSKEIGTIFFSMAIGLATGMGYVGYAAIFTVIVALLSLCSTRAVSVRKSPRQSSLRSLFRKILTSTEYLTIFSINTLNI